MYEYTSTCLFSLLQTQVCVQQTCLDLLERGMDVHLLADGCSSRSQVDRIFALEVGLYICMASVSSLNTKQLYFDTGLLYIQY